MEHYDMCFCIKDTYSVICDVMLKEHLVLPDDLLDEHCVHRLFIEDRILFHHFLNTKRLRDLFNDARHDLLHYLQ